MDEKSLARPDACADQPSWVIELINHSSHRELQPFENTQFFQNFLNRIEINNSEPRKIYALFREHCKSQTRINTHEDNLEDLDFISSKPYLFPNLTVLHMKNPSVWTVSSIAKFPKLSAISIPLSVDYPKDFPKELADHIREARILVFQTETDA